MFERCLFFWSARSLNYNLTETSIAYLALRIKNTRLLKGKAGGYRRGV